MLKAQYIPYNLIFKTPSGTSRGVLEEKTSYFLKIWNESNPEIYGLGECSLIKGLSPDNELEIISQLDAICVNPNLIDSAYLQALEHLPALKFAVEMALL